MIYIAYSRKPLPKGFIMSHHVYNCEKLNERKRRKSKEFEFGIKPVYAPSNLQMSMARSLIA